VRYATVRLADKTHAIRIDGDRAVLLAAPDVGALLRAGTDSVDATGDELEATELDFAPLIVRPGKMVCLGLNYESHIREMGRELPTDPTLFPKYPESLIGAHDDIVLPPESEQVDWEAELAFVIGTRVRRADAPSARAAIAGYTVCNDISMRDWQHRTMQWVAGKTWERSTPLGPMLVTPEEVDHARDLAIGCDVDGEPRQAARTSDLVFDPVEIIRYVSTICTLQPGDVISTGTPGGVGAGMDPPVFLKAGQTVRTWIEQLGELRNDCIEEVVG
jgi:acylpyruvate hydrolase